MNGVDLKKLRRLHTQATAAPWTWEATGEKSNEWCLGTEYEGEVIDWIAQSGSCENQADPELICEVRNGLPKLLDDLDELTQAGRELYEAWDRGMPHVNKMLRLGRALVTLGVKLRTAQAKDQESK